MPSGHGKKELKDGTMYEGAWVDGKAMGQGIKKLANGTIFEGTWEDSDFLEGKC